MTEGQMELLISKVMHAVSLRMLEVVGMMREFYQDCQKDKGQPATSPVIDNEPDKATSFNPPFDEKGRHVDEVGPVEAATSQLKADPIAELRIKARYRWAVGHQDEKESTKVKAEAARLGIFLARLTADPCPLTVHQALLKVELHSAATAAQESQEMAFPETVAKVAAVKAHVARVVESIQPDRTRKSRVPEHKTAQNRKSRPAPRKRKKS